MKNLTASIILVAVSLASVAVGQTFPAAPAPPATLAPAMESDPLGFEAPQFQSPMTRRSRASAALTTLGLPNEIRIRSRTYSGVFVQVVKSRNPWQLINPFAPVEAGSGYNNVARDITTGGITGLKFFAIGF